MTSIRVVRPDDAAELAQIVSDNAEHLQPSSPARLPSFYTEQGQAESIASFLEEAARGGCVPFVILGEGGEIVGRLGLNGITRGALQSCALSYWVRADRLRLGHASRAVALATAHAFTQLHLHRIQAETLPENVASQTVLRRAGFSLFGVAPAYLRINGRWQDHLMFQLLNEKYEEERPE